MSPNRIIWLVIKLVAALWMAAAGYAIFFIAPDEATMHEIQRIFYMHVASAWTAGVAFFVVAVAGVLYLIKRDPRYDWAGIAAAETALAFTTVVLVTGPIWARPIWGIWWTWDPRLTSTFVLWLMYIAYLLIRTLVDDKQRRAVLCAVYGIFAFADVPLVFMTIRWWRGQHPSPVIAGAQPGSGLDPTMRAVLFFTWGATLALFTVLMRSRYRLESIRGATEELRQQAEDSVVAPASTHPDEGGSRPLVQWKG
jgi:heme exporter protein C